MWKHAKPSLAIAAVVILVACVTRAEPPPSSVTPSRAAWEYKVLDLAVMPNYPTALVNPKTIPTAAELNDAERLMKIHSELNIETPQLVPSDSVDEFERRLAELGSEGWEMVWKDRNMVVFKRPKH